MRGLWWLMGALALALGAAPAAAAPWLEASSPHFIVYADLPEADLRRRAQELERVDAAARAFLGVPDMAVPRARKLSVFVLPSYADMVQLCECGGVLGFYVSRVDGSVAFTIRTKRGDDAADKSARIVFFHEYGHHLLLGTYELAFPQWFSEGFAEFVGTAQVEDGSVLLGSAANHRAWGLTTRRGLAPEMLFDPARMKSVTGAQFESLYARGWALTHYILFHADRFAQFKRYMAAISAGKPGMEAAKAAFGDLAALDAAAVAEAQKDLKAVRLPFSGPPAAVSVRPLSPGASELMAVRMRSVMGVAAESNHARALVVRANGVAKRYPDDPTVQSWFAEILFDAGRDAEAGAAADRALAAEPGNVRAQVIRARAAMHAASEAKLTDPARWAEIRAGIVRANRADPDDPVPLWLFFRSFERQGVEPSKSAIAGLYRAQELAPQDDRVRYVAALRRVRSGEIAEAKTLLRPLASSPHRRDPGPADRLLAALEAGRTGADAIAAAGDTKEPERD